MQVVPGNFMIGLAVLFAIGLVSSNKVTHAGQRKRVKKRTISRVKKERSIKARL